MGQTGLSPIRTPHRPFRHRPPALINDHRSEGFWGAFAEFQIGP